MGIKSPYRLYFANLVIALIARTSVALLYKFNVVWFPLTHIDICRDTSSAIVMTWSKNIFQGFKGKRFGSISNRTDLSYLNNMLILYGYLGDN